MVARLTLAACALLAVVAAAVPVSARRGRASFAADSPLALLIGQHYSDNRTGCWRCAGAPPTRRLGALGFEFEPPDLPMLQCFVPGVAGKQRKQVKQHNLQIVGDGVMYVVLRGAGKPRRATFVCRVCERRWLESPPPEGRLTLQTAEPQCRLGSKLWGVPRSGHPLSEQQGSHRRIDGVRCHVAERKGCDRGFAWCHGSCCRPQALFYYPHLQQDAGVGGRLLVQHEQGASPEERVLLLQLRRLLLHGRHQHRDLRPNSLAHALHTMTDEQRRRFLQ